MPTNKGKSALAAKKSPQSPTLSADQLYTLRDVAEITKISYETWSQWVRDGVAPVIPVVFSPKIIRFRGSDLLALIRGEVPAAATTAATTLEATPAKVAPLVNPENHPPVRRRRGRPTKAEQLRWQKHLESRPCA